MANVPGDSIRCIWEVRARFNEFGIVEQLQSGAVREVVLNDRELTAQEREKLARLLLPPGSRSRYVRFVRTEDNFDLAEAHRYYHPSVPAAGSPWDPKYWYDAADAVYLYDPDPRHTEMVPCPDCATWRQHARSTEHRSQP